jgi:hypothetical protein
MAGAPRSLVIIRGEFQRKSREKVRKKLRSTAQLLAHLAAGLAVLGLQRICPLKYYDLLRNFLRSMAICHAAPFMIFVATAAFYEQLPLAGGSIGDCQLPAKSCPPHQ